jgi:hypothetical protein
LKSNNGNGNTLKKWNQVVARIDNGNGQRGLAHHLRNRREQLKEAVCCWPDLLLKAAQVSLETRINQEFCEFVAELPNECLLKSFGGVGLEDKYRGLWESVRDKFAKKATPVAFEALVRVTPMSEMASEIVASYLRFPRDDYWRRVLRLAREGDDRSQKTIIKAVVSQIAFGKVAVMVPPNRRATFDEDTYCHEDPRKLTVYRTIPWAIADEAVARELADRVEMIIDCLELPEQFGRFLAVVKDREQGLVETLQSNWSKLKEVARRWVPGFGLAKITPDFWGLDPMDVGVIEVTVDPAGREFPALGVTLKGMVCFQGFIDHFEVGTDGVPDLSKWESDRERIFRLAVWSVVAARLWEYATAPEAEAAEYVAKSRSKKSGRKRPVPARFVRLPAGYKASEAAIARAIENRGYAPPPGKTFRMSPPIHERQTPDDYEAMVLVAEAPPL